MNPSVQDRVLAAAEALSAIAVSAAGQKKPPNAQGDTTLSRFEMSAVMAGGDELQVPPPTRAESRAGKSTGNCRTSRPKTVTRSIHATQFSRNQYPHSRTRSSGATAASTMCLSGTNFREMSPLKHALRSEIASLESPAHICGGSSPKSSMLRRSASHTVHSAHFNASLGLRAIAQPQAQSPVEDAPSPTVGPMKLLRRQPIRNGGWQLPSIKPMTAGARIGTTGSYSSVGHLQLEGEITGSLMHHTDQGNDADGVAGRGMTDYSLAPRSVGRRNAFPLSGLDANEWSATGAIVGGDTRVAHSSRHESTPKRRASPEQRESAQHDSTETLSLDDRLASACLSLDDRLAAAATSTSGSLDDLLAAGPQPSSLNTNEPMAAGAHRHVEGAGGGARNESQRAGTALGLEGQRGRRRRRRDSIFDRILKPLNRWQQTVVMPAFQMQLAHRLLLLRRVLRIFSVGIVPLKKKLELLSPLPLFALLSTTETTALARMMHPRLVGRYAKVLRAGCAPAAFYVVLWGSVTRTDGSNETYGVGDCFGQGALANICQPAPPKVANGTEAAEGSALAPRVRRASSLPPQHASNVPLEPCDLQAAEPTMLLALKLTEVDVEANPWFVALQRRYVSSQMKSGMLLRVPSLMTAGEELCAQLAACFTLCEPKAAVTLYSKGDRADCAYLIVGGGVELIAKPPPHMGVSSSAPLSQPPAELVVAKRTHESDLPWVGEGAILHPETGGPGGKYRRTHTAITTDKCQLLKLPRKEFGKFERLAAVLLPMLRSHERQLEGRLAALKPEQGEEDLSQMQGVAKELATAARLRLMQQTEAHARFLAAQRKDDKALFIFSLVGAYRPTGETAAKGLTLAPGFTRASKSSSDELNLGVAGEAN